MDLAAVALIAASGGVASTADSVGVDSATVDSPDVDRLAVDSTAERDAVAAFTVAVASMVEAVRTVEAVTAADTGKS
ncbi:MAG TPA: hypothetical protein VN881_06220 [Candidatus Acidoferrales bacterium]|nr:hypothetical protein [Candidatus Acidoferrales bacterium]